MNTNFTWSTTERGEKTILYNNHLYGLRRENKNGSFVYICTFKSCSRTVTLKDNTIIKSNGLDHNHGAYQKVLRSISHRYIDVIQDAKDSSDEE
jgi:hypothetical protein